MKVRLTYFKPSGKFYAGGDAPSLEVPETQWHAALTRVRAMHDAGTLPDLVAGACRRYFVLVELLDDPRVVVPHLLKPVEPEVGP